MGIFKKIFGEKKSKDASPEAASSFPQENQSVAEMQSKKDVKGLINALKRIGVLNVFDRMRAATALGIIGDKRAIEPLIQALRDDQSMVRKAAADALDKMRWKPKNDTDKSYYLIAKERWDDLVKLGKPAIEPLLQSFEYAGSKDESARTVARIGKSAVAHLGKALKPPKFHWVRRAAAQALGGIGGEEAIGYLAKALKDEVWDVQLEAAKALNKLGFQPRNDLEKAYLLFAQEKYDKMVELGEPAVEPLIRDLIRIGKPETANYLIKIGEPAIEPFIKALDNQATWARYQASRALGEMGDARAIDALNKLLQKETEKEVLEVAKHSVAKIKAKTLGHASDAPL